MSPKQVFVVGELLAGRPVLGYREGGNSMVPKIYSMQPVDLHPVDSSLLEPGDMVLVKVRGRMYTHLVTALRGDEVQIGNNHGHINGWTPREKVYGIVTAVEGRQVSRALSKVARS